LVLDVNGAADLSAASIVEFAAVSEGRNYFRNMDVVVNAGDLSMYSSGVFRVVSTPEDGSALSSRFVFSGSRLNRVLSQSASESAIQFDTDRMLQVSADQQITVATTSLNSDLVFSSEDDLNLASPDISVTAMTGLVAARNTLRIQAQDDVTFDVTGQDFFAKSVGGDVDLLGATGDLTFTTEDDFNAQAAEVYIQTKSQMTWNGRDVSVRQPNLDSPGNLNFNVDDSVIINSLTVEYDTAGQMTLSADDAFTVQAETIEVKAAKAFIQLLFRSQSVDVTADEEIRYQTELFSVNSNSYSAQADNLYSTVARNNVRVQAGTGITSNADQIAFTSQLDQITLDSGSDITYNVDNYRSTSFANTLDTRGPLSLSAETTITMNAGNSLTAEVQNKFTMNADDAITLNAEDTAQFLQDRLRLIANDLSYTAGEAIYLSQNLPDDVLNFGDADTFTVTGNYVDISSGRNIIIDTTDITSGGNGPFGATATNSIQFDTTTFTVDASGRISLNSNGELRLISTNATFDANNDFIVSGPQGEQALTRFRSGGPIAITGADGIFRGNDINFNANTFTANLGPVLINQAADQPTSPTGKFSVLDESSVSVSATDRFTTTSGAFNFFYAGTDLNVVTENNELNLVAQTNLEVGTRLLNFTADEFTLRNSEPDGLITFEADQWVVNARTDLNATTGDQFYLYSGDFLRYIVDDDITLTSPTVILEGRDQASFSGQDVVVRADQNVQILAGADTFITLEGNYIVTATDALQYEAATMRSRIAGDLAFDAEDDFDQYAYDGAVTYYGLDTTTFTATNGDIDYSVAGSFFVEGGDVTFTGNGVPAGQSLVGVSNLPDADIIFNTVQGNIIGDTEESLIYTTENFAEFVAGGYVSFDSAADLNVLVEDRGFDIYAYGDVTGSIASDLTLTAEGYGRFQTNSQFLMNSKDDFLVKSDGNLLAASGQQGGLWMRSTAGGLTATTTTYQYWKSSVDFSANVTGTAQTVTQTGDVSIFTQNGEVDFSSVVDTTTTVGGKLSFTSGDMLRFEAGGVATFATQSTFNSTAVQGDIRFQGTGITYTAKRALNLDAQGQLNPGDGIDILAGGDLTFQTDPATPTTLTIEPVNNLVLGEETRPTVLFQAAGTPTQVGFSLSSQGNIWTESKGTTTYSATTGTYFLSALQGVEVKSNQPMSFTATQDVDVSSDAGNIHIHGRGYSATGAGVYNNIATNGQFDIFSENMGDDNGLSFTGKNQLLMQAPNFFGEVGSLTSETTTVLVTVTGTSTFSTLPTYMGSLLYDAGDSVTVTSKGAVIMQSLDQDSTVSVRSDRTVLTTGASGDINLLSAGKFKMDVVAPVTFTTGTSFLFKSTSQLSDDGTTGDISFDAVNTLTTNAGDTFTSSAGNKLVYSADDQVTLTSFGDLDLESTDDFIVNTDDLLTNSKELFFRNSDGNRGSVNFYSDTGLGDRIAFTAVDGVTWNTGENVLGDVVDDVTFLATGTNNARVSLELVTTKEDADIVFRGGKQTIDFSSVSDTTIDTNTGAPGVLGGLGYKTTTYQFGGPGNFTSSSGDIVFDSQQGSFFIDSTGAVRYFGETATGRIAVTANGINKQSNAGIELIGRNGGLLMGAPNGEINVSAFESVEFRANMNTAASVIDLSFGYAPRLVANTFTPPVPSKTAVVATQPGADVYFNLLNGQGGVGRFQILAGQTGQPLDAKLANSQVDIITSETTRFETESGLAFQGYKDQQLLDRPGDVFFISSGRFAGVELSTKGAMADIDVNAASLLIDADEKLSVRTAGEDGTSLRFRAADGKVLVRVDSPNNVVNSDLEDGIDINAYDGRIEIGTSPFGDIVFLLRTR